MKNLLFQCAFILSICLVFVGCPAPPAHAAAIDARLQSILADAAAAEAIPVIVTFHDGVDFSRLPAGPRHLRRAELVRTLKSRAAAAQAPAREFLRGRGVGPIKDLWIINGLAVTVSPATILALAARPEVQSIRYDEVIPLSVPEISPSQITGKVEPNIELVNAPTLWKQGFAGEGVTVAVMDSGVDLNHPDLRPSWRGGSNSWFDPNGEHPDYPVDMDGHGTGVLGILVGGNAGGSVIGVAPEAQWIAVKIFNDAGKASTSAIHQGFGWLLDPDGNPATDDAPDVVNNSWGFEDTTGVCDLSVRIFQADLQALKAAGIAVVFAAGNTGPDANTSVAPANYPEAFAVGSVGTDQSTTTISHYSACGPSACDGTVYPEAMAPGYNVRTADLTVGGASSGAYVRMAGTSFAAPHVSGVMALLLGAFPETRVEALETVLKSSAVDMGKPGADNSYGYGLVDAPAAFNLLNDALLGVVDPVEPPDDGLLSFGQVPVGSSATKTLTLQNDGSGFLFVQSISVAGYPSAFSITNNTCTQALSAAESCTVAVRFAPTTHKGLAARLDVSSNGSVSGVSSVELAGIGNSPAPAPQPVTPVDDATGLGTTVVLQWDQLPDVDGDPMTSAVLYSTSPDFSQSTPIEVTLLTPAGGGALLAGVGGFLVFFGVAAGNSKKKWQVMVGGLLVTILMLLLSCGGGGGGGGGGVPAVERLSHELTGLAPATTYFWKVTVADGLGGRTEGPVRSFTTR
jgi:bacillopeptidase F